MTQRAFPFIQNEPGQLSRKIVPNTYGWDCAICGKKITDEFGNIITNPKDLPEEKHPDYEKYYNEEGYTGIEITSYDINVLELTLQRCVRKSLSYLENYFNKYSGTNNFSSFQIIELIYNSFKDFFDLADTNNLNEISKNVDINKYALSQLVYENFYYFADPNKTVSDKMKEVSKIVIALTQKLKNKIQDLANHIGKKEEFHQHYIESLPICLDCIEENTIYCNEDECEFTSLDEEDFYIVNDHYYCKEHSFECQSCSTIFTNDDKITSENGDNYCSQCYNEYFTNCYECNAEVSNDNVFVTDDGEAYCRDCFEEYSDAKELNKQDQRAAHNVIMSESTDYRIPFDSNTISKSILPILILASKKTFSGVEEIVNFIEKRLQNKEAKIFIPNLISQFLFSSQSPISEGIDRAIKACEKQLEENARTKKLYGKELRMFPVNFKIEPGALGHGGTSFVIYPSELLLEYAESCSSGAREYYKKHLAKIGHHPGALGYARLSESNGNIIVDNLQTDLDSQNLNIEKPNAAWWANTIKKFWLTTLLDMLRKFGNKIGKPIYLTSFKMQQEKWDRIPDRNKDVYDRIPEAMGFEIENIRAKPESLDSDYYNMRRIAQETKKFFKKCSLLHVISQDSWFNF